MMSMTCRAVLAMLLLINAAQAELFDRGGGLIYDDVLDITWLQDANYTSTLGVGQASGRMSWGNANDWVENLVYVDEVRGVSYSDWRLPTNSPVNSVEFVTTNSNDATTDVGHADADGWVDASGNPVSELGHLYYVTLGNLGLCSPLVSTACVQQPGWGLENTGPFQNIRTNGYYWSSGQPDPAVARYFQNSMGAGKQITNTASVNHYIWPVRDGDVAVDTDTDGIVDAADNCPLIANADQNDVDSDTVGDACDNCLDVANADQCNTNDDNFGNLCDSDLDNNGIVNSFDLGIMRTNFGTGGDNDADITCNGIVNSFDLMEMRSDFGLPPGPSGYELP